MIVKGDDCRPKLLGAGIVPLVTKDKKVAGLLDFWEKLLDGFKDDRVYICSELNVGSSFASQFFAEEQAANQVVLRLIDSRLSKNNFEFVSLSPQKLGFLFGVKKELGKEKVKKRKKQKDGSIKEVERRPVLKTVRTLLRERVVDVFDLDPSAVQKSLDAWDSVCVALGGYYIKYGRYGEFTVFVVKCEECKDKFVLALDHFRSCRCGKVLGKQREGSPPVVRAERKTMFTVVSVSDLAFETNLADSMVEKVDSVKFEAIE